MLGRGWGPSKRRGSRTPEGGASVANLLPRIMEGYNGLLMHTPRPPDPLMFTHLSGYMRRATPMPGQYDRKAARAVSSRRPKIRILFLGEKRDEEITGVT